MLHTKGYKCYNPQTRQTHVSTDVSFWENQSYFGINHLQSKKEREEYNFWDIYVPLYNIILSKFHLSNFFFSYFSKILTQEKSIQDIINKGNLNQPLLSIDVSQTRGQILQNDQNKLNSKLLIYIRTHEKGKKLPITLIQNQPKSLRDGPFLWIDLLIDTESTKIFEKWSFEYSK